MREQVCKYMCPYARFQSAMFDHDTLIVTYDAERGEPRGARSKKTDLVAANLGSCVDCSLCVQVCPTGIDIRNGLQYECIGCGACADVCDTVMDKLGYAKGLVRYTTQNAMDNKWTTKQTLMRVLRPRVLVYTSILMALIIAVGASLATRTPFKVDVVRDRATLARITENGGIENIYRLQVMNASEVSGRHERHCHHHRRTSEGGCSPSPLGGVECHDSLWFGRCGFSQNYLRYQGHLWQRCDSREVCLLGAALKRLAVEAGPDGPVSF
jgi:cytochrome c oxidase accessory protein FixG